MNSLCPTCSHVEEIVSRTGSRFWKCERSRTDPAFPKYPPQPVVRCRGHEPRSATTRGHALTVLPQAFALCRLAADAPDPAWASGAFVSLTRTDDEVSVVCPEALVPAGVAQQTGWRCLRVEGPLELSMVGVIAELARVLADAAVPVFVVATFSTDFVLVPGPALDRATAALQAAGHRVW